MNDKEKNTVKKNQTKKRRVLLIGRVFLFLERMILSKEFYDKCCPTYQKAIDELEKELADIGVLKGYQENQDKASRRELLAAAKIKRQKVADTISNFAAKYLTPKEYWEYVMHYFDGFYFPLRARKNFSYHFAEIAFSHHLYYNQEWNSINCTRNVVGAREYFLDAYDGERFKLLEFQMKHYLPRPADLLGREQLYDVTEQDFGYPHDHLKECFHQIERNANQLPSDKLVQQYRKMKTLFAKIKAAESGDVEVWFKLLREAGDESVVIDNVECRLGHDLFNVKLWKLYIAYLKEHDKCNRLVKTYSKYCRFFLEDVEMLEEFKAELAKHGKTDVPMDEMYLLDVKNVIETDDETQEDETSEDGDILPFDKSLCSTFFDSTRKQKFSLLIPMVRYIVKNANHRVLRKLFRSCKWFYAKRPIPICYRLETGNVPYNGEHLFLPLAANPDLFFKKTFITGVINVGDSAYSNYAFISTLIPRLHRCEAKYITLEFQHLTFDELKCLIQHGGVIELNFWFHCVLRDKQNGYVELEQILAYLPNIEVLMLPKVKTNKTTCDALSKFKFNSKIIQFSASFCGTPFDADNFLKFCIANRDEKVFSCFIHLSPRFDRGFVQYFKKIMDEYAKTCDKNCLVGIRLDND